MVGYPSMEDLCVAFLESFLMFGGGGNMLFNIGNLFIRSLEIVYHLDVFQVELIKD